MRGRGAGGADRLAEAVLHEAGEALRPVERGLAHLAVDVGVGGRRIDQLHARGGIADGIDQPGLLAGHRHVGEGPAHRAGGEQVVDVRPVGAGVEVERQGPAQVGGAQHDQARGGRGRHLDRERAAGALAEGSDRQGADAAPRGHDAVVGDGAQDGPVAAQGRAGVHQHAAEMAVQHRAGVRCIANLERPRRDGGAAGDGVDVAEDKCASPGLGQTAGPGDGAVEGHHVRAVEDQGAVVGDVADHRPGGPADAEL